LEEAANACDVGAEPCVDVLDEVDVDVCDLDLAVEIFGDWDWEVVAVEDTEPAVSPPVGLAMADFLTPCWLSVEVD
jgi:hypothetical protein